ncbi:MAG: cation transporter dimerization domain-containing protein, partial [Candidatus Nitrosomaritimum aestuariumsis]
AGFFLLGNHLLTRDALGVDPRADVHPQAEISGGVSVGPFTRIGKSSIGKNTIIESNVYISSQVVIGKRVIIEVGAILMRRSGDTIFADVTISLRGDTSFDKAHEISNRVENNIKKEISNSEITIHFEPTWENVPLDAKIFDIAKNIPGVKGVHNVSTHKSKGKTFSNLHVMVDREINLYSAHKISEIVEEKIQESIPEIEHVTIHLEPFLAVPESFNVEDKATERKISEILNKYPEIKNIGRIVSLNFENILKIDIDCSFDRNLSIEKVHDLTSEIEHLIRSEIQNAVITIHPEPV